jgi:hypothetical protein
MQACLCLSYEWRDAQGRRHFLREVHADLASVCVSLLRHRRQPGETIMLQAVPSEAPRRMLAVGGRLLWPREGP